jgi:hypothetical protein
LLLSPERDLVPARQIFDEAAHRASFTALRLFKTMSDAPESLQELMVFDKFLISFRALDNDFGMTVYRQHRRISRSLQLADKAFGVPLEVAQGVNLNLKARHICNLHYIYCEMLVDAGAAVAAAISGRWFG